MFLTYYHYIAIDREYRHRGIGSELYRMVTEMCYEQGAQWAVVKTWSKNMISQAMFRKHGFYHAATIEDDRSKGVHSYLFIRSFSQVQFPQVVTHLCIVGSGAGLVNFIKTLRAITKDTPNRDGQLQISMVNISDSANLEMLTSDIPASASHIMFADLSTYGQQDVRSMNLDAEVPDAMKIAKSIFEYSAKRWLFAGEEKDYVVWDLEHISRPRESDRARITEIIEDIAAGYTQPGYYRDELIAISVANDCSGILIGSDKLHGAFGIERMVSGIQVFDPLLELAIIIQNNRA